MRKLSYLLFVFAVCFNTAIFSQTIGNKNQKVYSKIPQEQIFLHYNTSLIQSGEKLYYKVYNINRETQKLSSLSKIAYVELIDNNYKVHFRHKIRLDSGFGQGDFFVPTSVSSGNYKLIAYTNWMKNGGANNFFHDNITIINPFSDNSNFIVSKSDSTQKSHVNTDKVLKNSNNRDSFISMNLDKNEFNNREKVSIGIDLKNNDVLNGNYSLSIRKIDDMPYIEKSTSDSYIDIYSKNNSSNTISNNSVIIPEFRGELIYGKVLNTATNEAVQNVPLSLSIPGKDYVFKTSRTNSEGVFYFNVDKRYTSENAVVQILSKNPQDLTIQMSENSQLNYGNLTFQKFELSENYKNLISSRSIKNQIENSYNSLKQDSLRQNISDKRFYNPVNYTYVLDDFKRFKTLSETITEIIEYLYYTKKGDQYVIQTRTKDLTSSISQDDVLVLIDGVLILDHGEIMDFNTDKVKKITVINNNFFYGTVSFNGLVDIETFDGDYKNLRNTNYSKNIDLFKPLTPKKYFNLVYDNTNKLSRIPDFRNQLLWNPSLKFEKNNSEISFYTSDLNGTFEINLEGFSKDGKPVSIKKYFSVK